VARLCIQGWYSKTCSETVFSAIFLLISQQPFLGTGVVVVVPVQSKPQQTNRVHCNFLATPVKVLPPRVRTPPLLRRRSITRCCFCQFLDHGFGGSICTYGVVRIQQFIEPSFGGVSTIFGAVAFVCANGSGGILEGQSHVVNGWGFIPMKMGSSSLSVCLSNEIYNQRIHLTSFWPRFC
jgi:hypothetical protein